MDILLFSNPQQKHAYIKTTAIVLFNSSYLTTVSSQTNRSSYRRDFVALSREMANKSIIAVVLLLCVAGIFEVQARSRLIGSGSISSSGVWGKKRDFSYHVPSGATGVSFNQNVWGSGGLTVGGGNGKATLRWTKGSRTASVHAWVNGRFCLSLFGCRANRVAWNVYAHFD